MLDGNEVTRFVSYTKQNLMTLADSGLIGVKLGQFGATNDRTVEICKKYLRWVLRAGEFVYWDFGIVGSAYNGASVFCGKKFPLFSPSIQIWVYGGSGYRYRLMSGADSVIIAHLLDCSSSPGEIKLWTIEESPSDSDVPNLSLEPLAAMFNEDDRILIDGHGSLQIAAAIEFMNQPFIEKTTLDRVATFTGAHQQQKRNDAKKIRVVYLRRREQHPTLSDGTPNPVDWSCQWLVRGHWRNQYLPSTQGHEPRFIQSYVKGPDDKPFKASAGSIFAAVR